MKTSLPRILITWALKNQASRKLIWSRPAVTVWFGRLTLIGEKPFVPSTPFVLRLSKDRCVPKLFSAEAFTSIYLLSLVLLLFPFHNRFGIGLNHIAFADRFKSFDDLRRKKMAMLIDHLEITGDVISSANSLVGERVSQRLGSTKDRILVSDQHGLSGFEG